MPLYIPHGSDESVSRLSLLLSLVTLYPTWFRWKFYLVLYFFCLQSVLYIPHGSDERAFFLGWKKGVLRFISHMVQMKGFLTIFLIVFVVSTLYPTWFRWKVGIKHIFANSKLSFISHMVQMKGTIWRSSFLSEPCFISHMVQMKAFYIFLFTFLSYLYIPHGSDESHRRNKMSAKVNNFISHMVQMKGCFCWCYER